MANIYRVNILNSGRQVTAQLNNYTELAINLRVNYPGMLQATFPGDISVINSLEDTAYIEVLRKNPQAGVDWVKEFGGLFLRQDYKWPEDAPKKAIITALDYKVWLAWRIISYAASKSGYTDFSAQPAETLVKTLVEQNLGATADTDPDRLISGGALSDLTVDTDQGRGNSVSIGCSNKVLLDTIAKIAEIGGGDYNLVMADDYSGFVFYWYPGQLGTDRSSSLAFSMDKGNMKNPEWVRNRIDERTIALVGGAGKGASRYTRAVQSSTYAANNHREIFVDARDLTSSDAAKMDDRGSQSLKQHNREDTFTFEVAQNENSTYRKDYFLGDLVKAVNPFTEASGTYQITQTTSVIKQTGEEDIAIEVTKQ